MCTVESTTWTPYLLQKTGSNYFFSEHPYSLHTFIEVCTVSFSFLSRSPWTSHTPDERFTLHLSSQPHDKPCTHFAMALFATQPCSVSVIALHPRYKAHQWFTRLRLSRAFIPARTQRLLGLLAAASAMNAHLHAANIARVLAHFLEITHHLRLL